MIRASPTVFSATAPVPPDALFQAGASSNRSVPRHVTLRVRSLAGVITGIVLAAGACITCLLTAGVASLWATSWAAQLGATIALYLVQQCSPALHDRQVATQYGASHQRTSVRTSFAHHTSNVTTDPADAICHAIGTKVMAARPSLHM